MIPEFFARDDTADGLKQCTRGVGRLDFLHAPLFATHGPSIELYLKTANPKRRLVVLSYVGVWTKVSQPLSFPTPASCMYACPIALTIHAVELAHQQDFLLAHRKIPALCACAVHGGEVSTLVSCQAWLFVRACRCRRSRRIIFRPWSGWRPTAQEASCCPCPFPPSERCLRPSTLCVQAFTSCR